MKVPNVQKTPDFNFVAASNNLTIGQKKRVTVNQQKSDDNISLNFVAETNVADVVITQRV